MLFADCIEVKIKKSMVALIIEGAVGDDDVGWVALGFFTLLLLRTDHDQRQLTGGLPDLVFFHDLLSVCGHLLCPGVVPGFRTFDIVDLVARVLSIGVDGRTLFLFLFLDDASAGHDVEASLGFSDDFPILVFFEADIFFLEVFLGRFVALVY